jgi:acylphosphatase
MIARLIVIRGLVQGVGYRYAMVEIANAHRVAGWVRNRRDGTVEAFAQGDAAAVEAIIAWCRRGPPAAHVEDVAVSPTAVDLGVVDFSHRPTT